MLMDGDAAADGNTGSSDPYAEYEVRLTDTSERMLRDIKKERGKATYEQLKSLILDLATQPYEKTKPLAGMLKGFRSLHCGRFRIIVTIDDADVRVFVVGVGWHTSGDRKDIYQVLTRMIESGTLVVSQVK